MNRRQLLKGMCAAAVAAPATTLALGTIKSERGVAPSVASPIPHGYRPTLLECFQEYPDGDYYLEDKVFTEHFYPKPGLEGWFETTRVIRQHRHVVTNAAIFVRFREAADKYCGIAELLGISRQQVKVRYLRRMYGGPFPRHWSNAGAYRT